MGSELIYLAGIALFVAILFLLGWVKTMDTLDEEKFQHDNTKFRLNEKIELVEDYQGRLEVQKAQIVNLSQKLQEADQQNIFYATIIDQLNKHLDDFPRRGADGKFVKNPEADGKAEK